MIRTVTLRSVLVLSVAGSSGARLQPTLAVEIRDDATGEIAPAMVCVTSLREHAPRKVGTGIIFAL